MEEEEAAVFEGADEPDVVLVADDESVAPDVATTSSSFCSRPSSLDLTVEAALASEVSLYSSF